MIAILTVTLVLYVTLLALWLRSEITRNTRQRIGLGLAAILLAIPASALITTAITQLDDNSYYAATIRELLDETIEAIENNETNYANRLKEFKDEQSLTYEERGGLLENTRSFRQEGREKRK